MQKLHKEQMLIQGCIQTENTIKTQTMKASSESI